MAELETAFQVLEGGTLWHNPAWTPTNKRCAGYADANAGESAKVAAYVGTLDAGNLAAAPPALASATGRGLVGMLAALAKQAAAGGTVDKPTSVQIVKSGTTLYAVWS